MVRARTLLLILITAVALSMHGQSIPSGQVILVKSPSGKHLSAVPGQTLALSVNTAAWEQWQFLSESGSWLISYHGTILIPWDFFKNQGPIHAPWAYADPNLTYASDSASYGSIDASPSPGGLYYFHLGEPPVAGKPFVLVTNSRPRRILCEKDGQLTAPEATMINDGNGYLDAAGLRNCGWVPVSISAPQSGRAARQNSIVVPGPVAFRSAHGTYIYPGPGLTTTPGGPRAIVHSTLTGLSNSFKVFDPDFRRTRPVYYGQNVWIAWGNTATESYWTPNASSLLELVRPAIVNGKLQTDGATMQIVDPTGTYKPGDRVPRGARVALKSMTNGQYVSADPAKPQLFFVGHASGWEQWVLMLPSETQ